MPFQRFATGPTVHLFLKVRLSRSLDRHGEGAKLHLLDVLVFFIALLVPVLVDHRNCRTAGRTGLFPRDRLLLSPCSIFCGWGRHVVGLWFCLLQINEGFDEGKDGGLDHFGWPWFFSDVLQMRSNLADATL